MRISSIVSIVSSRKIPDIIDHVFKTQWFNGRGTYETKTWPKSYCYFWAMTPAGARLSIRQLPTRKFWIFEGFFPGDDPQQAHSVGVLLSCIDGLSRIIAMGDGQSWYFDHTIKAFKKNDAPRNPWPGM